MKKKSVAGSISLVMIIMIFSRLLALLSAQVYLSFFGAGGQEINIYSYAISVPNIVFNCFGTAIATVVIPIYAGHIARNEQVKAKQKSRKREAEGFFQPDRFFHGKNSSL